MLFLDNQVEYSHKSKIIFFIKTKPKIKNQRKHMNQLRERRKGYLGKVREVRECSGETAAFWCVKSGRGDE